jgi:hypothetical protein
MIYYRKIIKIKAEDSPNVQLGLAQIAAGLKPTNEILVPGVLSFEEYQYRRDTWKPERQTVGLDAEFYEGPELKLFPKEWLQLACNIERVALCRSHPAEAIGVDPGEGGANTVWAVINRYGLKEMISEKTPDTSVIPKRTLELMRKHPTVEASKVCFDRGGGGKQHADTMRSMHPTLKAIRTVGFGKPITLEPQRGMRQFPEKKEYSEDKYVYCMQRDEMFGELSILIDPAAGVGYKSATFQDGKMITPPVIGRMFAIPRDNAIYVELHRQLALFPRSYDKEGRLKLPPKTRNPGEKETLKKTLVEIMGASPDESDALAIAGHAMLHRPIQQKASAL